MKPTLLNVQSRGCREAGFRIGTARRGARLLAELLPGGFGRSASARSRSVFSIVAIFVATPSVARVVLGGQLVFAKGGFELILPFEVAGPIEVVPRRGLHRAFERDLVSGIVRIGQRGPPILGHCLIEISTSRRGVAIAKRLARGTSAGDQRTRQQYPESS